MAKKKKIREDFEKVFKAGDDKAIKELLAQNPWLLEEISQEMDAAMKEEDLILAAIGVMEDDLNHPVSMEEIILCLKQDFKTNKNISQIEQLLDNVSRLNLVKKIDDGWILTDEGGDACDEYIKKYRAKL
ncbi:MAG: hypothetical protein ACFFBP_00155 [Promethearchaeota archaeon]